MDASEREGDIAQSTEQHNTDTKDHLKDVIKDIWRAGTISIHKPFGLIVFDRIASYIKGRGKKHDGSRA